MRVSEFRNLASGIIMHSGVVLKGHPRSGDGAIALVDLDRRRDIMRNHTATHLLHAELRAVLGEHARQAGSLVAPDRLRFDFTHSAAVTPQELEQIEPGVNQAILGNYRLNIEQKPLQQAISEARLPCLAKSMLTRCATSRSESPRPFRTSCAVVRTSRRPATLVFS